MTHWHSSLDSASVKSFRRLSVLFTHSKTSRFCQVGTRCLVFLSAFRTSDMAFPCSSTRSVICCCDPRLVGVPVMRWCGGRWSSAWALASLLFLFQMQEHTLTVFLHMPIARSIRGSFTLLSVDKIVKYYQSSFINKTDTDTTTYTSITVYQIKQYLGNSMESGLSVTSIKPVKYQVFVWCNCMKF